MDNNHCELLKLGVFLFESGLEIDHLRQEMESMLQDGTKMSSPEFNEKYRILSDKMERWAQAERQWNALSSETPNAAGISEK